MLQLTHDKYDIVNLENVSNACDKPSAVLIKNIIVDCINKKLKVVNEVATAIGLQNLSTQHCRAEDIKNRKFDVVVSRAVAPLKDLWTWSKPLLKKGAKPSGLICLKGGDLANEIFESGCKPRVWEIEKIFDSPFFTDKYLLQVAI